MFKGKKSVKKEKKKSKLRFGNIFKMFKNKVRKKTFLWLQLHCYEGSFSWQKAKISQATVKEK